MSLGRKKQVAIISFTRMLKNILFINYKPKSWKQRFNHQELAKVGLTTINLTVFLDLKNNQNL